VPNASVLHEIGFVDALAASVVLNLERSVEFLDPSLLLLLVALPRAIDHVLVANLAVAALDAGARIGCPDEFLS
jgi:hypothetical protein